LAARAARAGFAAGAGFFAPRSAACMVAALERSWLTARSTGASAFRAAVFSMRK
jgi:hypothetical protein